MTANRNQRASKPTFRPDWLAAAVSAAHADGLTEWARFLTDRHRDERVRKAFNRAHVRWDAQR